MRVKTPHAECQGFLRNVNRRRVSRPLRARPKGVVDGNRLTFRYCANCDGDGLGKASRRWLSRFKRVGRPTRQIRVSQCRDAITALLGRSGQCPASQEKPLSFRFASPYPKPTQVGEERILRR